MPWRVWRVRRLDEIHPQILPCGKFELENEHQQRQETMGWLPCHHGNVEYELVFKKNGDIAAIVGMRMLRKKNRLPVSDAGKKIAQGKLAPMGYTKEQYLKQAVHAYKDQATWTVAMLYTHKVIASMDVNAVFACLVADPESVCTRGSVACIPYLMYNRDKAWDAIQRVLRTLGEPPYEDRAGFEDRMQWQLDTRYCTGALESPGDNIRNLQRYQDIWTTSFEIEQARTIGRAMAKDNCTLWLGTPCRQAMEGKKVVVATLEEAFALKCFVSVDNIYMLRPPFEETYRKEMGLPGIITLGKNEDVCVPWAHRWGIKHWLALAATYPKTFTCIGRVDQYGDGRGQVFRQMVDASFPCHIGHHFKVNNVEMVEAGDVPLFVRSLDYPTIQCFADIPFDGDIDTGRRWIKYPRRIRTLAQRDKVKEPRVALCEEYFTHAYKVGENASVVPVRRLLTPVDVGVYICSENTRAFDIHAARGLCRHKLYVVNCINAPFAWEHKAPRRISVSPFI